MKIYIATNKDNKDSLMHYGVKGMRWGKRGGRRAGDLEKDSTRTPYADTQSVSRVKTTNSKNNLLPIGRAHAAKKIMRKNVSAGSRQNPKNVYAQDRTKFLVNKLSRGTAEGSNRSGIYEADHRFTDINRLRDAAKANNKDWAYRLSRLKTPHYKNIEEFRKREQAKKDVYRQTKDHRREQELRRHGRR